jgi:hypothetical protein
MFKKFILGALAASGLALASVPAHAHGFVSVGIGVPGFVVAPAPFYAPPGPVVVAPRVYPPVIAYGPDFYRGGWGYPGWYRDGYRGWDHHHGWGEWHGYRATRR